jgi:hypothetical protein
MNSNDVMLYLHRCKEAIALIPNPLGVAVTLSVGKGQVPTREWLDTKLAYKLITEAEHAAELSSRKVSECKSTRSSTARSSSKSTQKKTKTPSKKRVAR